MHLNRDAQVQLVELALPHMSRGAQIIFVTSHLAHFYGRYPVLPGYEPVAVSKKAGEEALRAKIPALDSLGICLTVVSGDMIEGTITPKLLERKHSGLLQSRRDMVGHLPTVDDFAKVIADTAADPDLASGATIYVGSTDILT